MPKLRFNRASVAYELGLTVSQLRVLERNLHPLVPRKAARRGTEIRYSAEDREWLIRGWRASRFHGVKQKHLVDYLLQDFERNEAMRRIEEKIDALLAALRALARPKESTP